MEAALLVFAASSLSVSGCADASGADDGGLGEAADASRKRPCVPTTCTAQGKDCGTISDGCRGSLDCGSCTAPRTCGGGGVPNVCGGGGCQPTTCAAQGKNCGTISDDCGGTLDCGSCTAPRTCGGGGVTNVCGSAGSLPPPAGEFHVMQTYMHDGGYIATVQTTDLGFDSASFMGQLTTAEQQYLAAHHGMFGYFSIPTELVESTVNYFASDPNYATAMKGFVASYGMDNMYLLPMPEYDNDPGNASWAYNRFLDVGVTGSRPDIPTGLTRQQAYDQFKTFYLADNVSTKNHQQLGRILSVPPSTRGYKVQATPVWGGTTFYTYEMGADLAALERNNDDISGLVGGIALVRGAAMQYGRPWSFDMSNWRTALGSGPTSYDANGNMTGGWSAMCTRRTNFLAYMSGPLAFFMEPADYTANGKTLINGHPYTPIGIEQRDFDNFALVRHPGAHRGTPHVPVAIMKDHISFWEPKFGRWMQGRAVWYAQMSPNGGENMLYNLYDLIYPGYNTWGSSTDTTEPMGSGRWGEQFNVVTERISASALGNHKVVVLSTDAAVDSTLQATLTSFAQAGGIVVVNAKQLSGTAHEALTGVHLVGTAQASGAITWDADGSTTNEASYNYSTVTLGTATVLAHSGTNTPLLTRNVVGAGEVWVTLPDYLSNAGNTATLGLAAKIFDTLIHRFAVATVTSTGANTTIDYAVNERAGADGTATVLTIVNNDTSGAAWNGTITFPGTAGNVTEWISDAAVPCSTAGGNVTCDVSVPAYDVRVFAR